MSSSHMLRDLRSRSESFLQITGRRPRVLLTHVEKKTSSIPLKSFAVVFADAGFDVDISPGFINYAAIARMAVENDVHALGIIGCCSETENLNSLLSKELFKLGDNDIKIYVEKEKIDEQMMSSHQNFEKIISRSAEKTLKLIGA